MLYYIMPDNNLLDIISKVKQGNVSLFLGAGVSCAAGGPSGEELTNGIKKNFPKINQELNDLIDVCQDVNDTPPYGLNELEKYIKSQLNALQPSKYHMLLTKYDWPVIFTPNFDDLIELAYRTSTIKIKDCTPVYGDKFYFNLADRSKLFLFKMMGSITTLEGESGAMVLTRAEYNRALVRRRKYFEHLMDFVKNGTMVFIGYGFYDRLVLDAIGDLIDIYGIDKMPWSYALFKDIGSMDEKTKHMFSSRRIIPVKCGFEEFIDQLDSEYEGPSKEEEEKKFFIKIKGYTLSVDASIAKANSEHFDFLHEDVINQPSGDKDSFFMGTNHSWGVFYEKFDFIRDIYNKEDAIRNVNGKNVVGCLIDNVLSDINNIIPEKNKILLINGMPGSGKTITSNRLAFDVYRSGKAPVLFVNKERTNLDFKSITSFIEDLNSQIDKLTPAGKRIAQLKPLIIFDDAANNIRQIKHLRNYLTSRGRCALLVSVERSGEWNAANQFAPITLKNNDIFELNEDLTDNEKSSIIDHFFKLGYVDTRDIAWDDIINRSFGNSYFATIYSLVHPSKKPLDEIIKDQYRSLSAMSKKAFEYICCFHKYDFPINMELLVRTLQCSYQDFIAQVLRSDADKIIFEETDKFGNVLYKAHHRIIAQKTVEYFLSDSETQKNLLHDIFSAAHLSNKKERDLCEGILVNKIGPNSRSDQFTYSQLSELFEVICENNKTRTLLHHWGILEKNNEQLEKAESLLNQALGIPRDNVESFRGESDQNILTTLGSIYSMWGLNADNEVEAQEYFGKAEKVFATAKFGDFPNAYAYHSHAHMWFSKGRKCQIVQDKLYYCSKSIDIIELAKDNINEDDLKPLMELEAQAWMQIGSEEIINASILKLKESHNSPSGYYLLAEYYFYKAKECDDDEKRKLFEKGLDIVNIGLGEYPYDEACLRIKCRLYSILEKEAIEHYEILSKWYSSKSYPNVNLLFDLARISFMLGYYDKAKNIFKELEAGVGLGHKWRIRPRCFLKDEAGIDKFFEGKVYKLITMSEGFVSCDDFRQLDYPIVFRPIAQKFTPGERDRVKFNIAFNFRDPIALNMVKI